MFWRRKPIGLGMNGTPDHPGHNPSYYTNYKIPIPKMLHFETSSQRDKYKTAAYSSSIIHVTTIHQAKEHS
jgi:hypothetical protein